MRITKFWAKGYRSLRDVELDGLGAFNVFYGPNGSGKSNVLAAVDTLFRAPVGGVAGTLPPSALSEHDFFGQSDTSEVRLGAVVEFEPNEPAVPPKELGLGLKVEVEVTFRRAERGEGRVSDFMISEPGGARLVSESRQNAAIWWRTKLAPRAFNFVPGLRVMKNEVEGAAPSAEGGDPVLDEVRTGNIKTALFNAKNSPNGADLARYDAMRALMSTQLKRPAFNATRDPRTRVIELVEALPGPNVERVVVPIQRAGCGAEQLYGIVAMILFSHRRMIGIDEPEVHLHAPTTGRQLRGVLAGMLSTNEGGSPLLDQLFIATHSNLFDLDPTGYWDVSMVDGETRITRKPLDEIDARHLYEPGPAKHALMQLLRYAPDDEVVFRTGDGQQLKAREMLAALESDTDVAVAFLESMHAAAMQVTGLRARRMAAQRPEAAK